MAVGFFALTGVASAQVGPQSSGLDDALQSIYKAQNVATSGQVDCSKVTDSQFETLGDAYMEQVTTREAP